MARQAVSEDTEILRILIPNTLDSLHYVYHCVYPNSGYVLYARKNS